MVLDVKTKNAESFVSKGLTVCVQPGNQCTMPCDKCYRLDENGIKEVEKKLTKAQKGLMWTGGLSIMALLAFVFRKIRR